MKRIEFLIWAGKQGWKHGQTYLNKAYNHFFDKGKVPNAGVILQKAKDYYKNFIGFKPKIVPKTKQIVEKIKTVKPGEKVIVPIGSKKPPFILTKTPKPKGPAEIIQFPKKPPGKADGGRIAKALPTRSRDI